VLALSIMLCYSISNTSHFELLRDDEHTETNMKVKHRHELITDTMALIVGALIIGGWFVILGVCYVTRIH
jgi:hypothetical protein